MEIHITVIGKLRPAFHIPMSDIQLPQQNELEKYSEWQEMLVPVTAQLEKDFLSTGLDWDNTLNNTTTYPELFQKLLPAITRLIDQKFEQFAQLLYRVDISEAQVNKAGQLYPEKNFPELATELLILRELHKVIIRKYYRS
ncbi:MAG: hypothetical protein FD123_2471 [Bacteroidetes bacterium]|nr:MAG: hypothetical protein FD123_2471 [Bacteroidota bacterium]